MKKKLAMLCSCLIFVFVLSGCQIAENNFQAIVASFTKPTTETPPEEPTTEEVTEEVTTTEELTTQEPENQKETKPKKNDQTKTNQNSNQKKPSKKVDQSDNKKKDNSSNKVDKETVTTEETTTEATVSIVSISYDGTFQDTYYTGEEAVFSKQEITATYDNGSKKAIPFSQCQISGFDTSSAGSKTVTITYSGKFVKLNYKVLEDAVTGLSAQGSMPVIPKGGNLDTTGLTIVATYTSGKSANIDIGACDISGFDSSAAGNKKMTVTYQGKSVQVSYTVKAFSIKYQYIYEYYENGSLTAKTTSGTKSLSLTTKQVSSASEFLGQAGIDSKGADEAVITTDVAGNSKVGFPLVLSDSNPTATIYVHYKFYKEVDEEDE